MIKLTTIVSLILICIILCEAGLNCNSCGSECVSACGTRRFRLCCFNYLRKKRDPFTVKFSTPNHDKKDVAGSKLLTSVFENPDFWGVMMNEDRIKADDIFENQLQAIYDA